MTNKELAEKLINNFGGIPYEARKITLEAATRLLQMVPENETQIGEISEAKSLRWLANMWPLVEDPKDEADKWSTTIHLYCTAAADRIDQMAETIEYARTIKQERDDLLLLLRKHGGCDFCKHKALHCDMEPCCHCRGTGGKNDKWEWKGVNHG